MTYKNNNRVTQYIKLPCVKNSIVVIVFPGSLRSWLLYLYMFICMLQKAHLYLIVIVPIKLKLIKQCFDTFSIVLQCFIFLPLLKSIA
jgi:F0F1-type ATP synthase membrane subunit a